MAQRRPFARRGWLLAAIGVLALAAFSGCGYGTVPVEGRVTYDGGPWPKPGVIHFLPEKPNPDFPSRPGKGEFDTDGRFTVTSYKPGDGLLPGDYSVAVECWLEPPSMEKSPTGRSAVPPKYQSGQTSGLKLTVEEGQPMRDVDLKVPKQ